MRMVRLVAGACAVTFVLALLGGCGLHATPMAGSIGTPSKGVLTHGATLEQNDSLHWLRQNDRHFGTPRFVGAIERAAARVGRERPEER